MEDWGCMHGDDGPGTMRKDTVHCWRPRDVGGLELNGRETWVGGQLGKSQGVGLAHRVWVWLREETEQKFLVWSCPGVPSGCQSSFQTFIYLSRYTVSCKRVGYFSCLLLIP